MISQFPVVDPHALVYPEAINRLKLSPVPAFADLVVQLAQYAHDQRADQVEFLLDYTKLDETPDGRFAPILNIKLQRVGKPAEPESDEVPVEAMFKPKLVKPASDTPENS